jgi:hypothetical protein
MQNVNTLAARSLDTGVPVSREAEVPPLSL